MVDSSAWRPAAFARRVGAVTFESIDRFFADQCGQHAAGIAYRVLFSMAPLAIVLVSIFGLVLQNDGIRNDVVNTIVDALPVSVAGRQDVADAITAIAKPASAVGLLGLVVFAWAATGMMASIRAGLEAAMDSSGSRPMVRGKLVDLVLIVGAAVLVLLTAGVTLLNDLAQRALERLDLGAVAPGCSARRVVRAVGRRCDAPLPVRARTRSAVSRRARWSICHGGAAPTDLVCVRRDL